MSKRHTKQRQFTVSGEDEIVVPSRSRPTKPPAKSISQRKAAALTSGGDALPTRIREELRADGSPSRLKILPRNKSRDVKSTRTGKRVPRAGRHVAGADARAKTPSRRSRNRGTDASARAVPAAQRPAGRR